MKEWLRNNYLWIICIIFVIWFFISLYLIHKKEYNLEMDQEQILKEQIDSLKNQIKIKEAARTGIQIQIDTVYKEIEKTRVIYDEKFNSVIYNTPDEDYRQFREYIDRNKSRLDSCIDIGH